MKVHHQAIPLSRGTSVTSDERLIKRGARALFSLLRSTANQAQRVPGILSQAATDIHEAWEESSRPNV